MAPIASRERRSAPGPRRARGKERGRRAPRAGCALVVPLTASLLAGGSFVPEPAWARGCPPLTLGVLPYVSPARLVAQQAPVVRHLEGALGVEVRIRTAPDFATFEQRVGEGRWTIVMTNPLQAQHWSERGRWTPVAETRRHIRALLIARADRGLTALRELRGGTLAASDPGALLYRLALEVLGQHELVPERDFELLWTGTHDNATLALLYGAADAAVTGERLFEALVPARRHRLRVLARSRATPGLVVLAAPDLPQACIGAVRSALRGFPGNAGPGNAGPGNAGMPGSPPGRDRSTTPDELAATPYLLEGFRVLDDPPRAEGTPGAIHGAPERGERGPSMRREPPRAVTPGTGGARLGAKTPFTGPPPPDEPP